MLNRILGQSTSTTGASAFRRTPKSASDPHRFQAPSHARARHDRALRAIPMTLALALTAATITCTPASALDVKSDGEVCTISPSHADDVTAERLRDEVPVAFAKGYEDFTNKHREMMGALGTLAGKLILNDDRLIEALGLDKPFAWKQTISVQQAQRMYEDSQPSPYFHANDFEHYLDPLSWGRLHKLHESILPYLQPFLDDMESQVGDEAYHRALGKCIGIGTLAELSAEGSSEDTLATISSDTTIDLDTDGQIAVGATVSIIAVLGLVGGFLSQINPEWLPMQLRLVLAPVFPNLAPPAPAPAPPAPPALPAPAPKPQPRPAPVIRYRPPAPVPVPQIPKPAPAPAPRPVIPAPKPVRLPKVHIDIRTNGPFPG